MYSNQPALPGIVPGPVIIGIYITMPESDYCDSGEELKRNNICAQKSNRMERGGSQRRSRGKRMFVWFFKDVCQLEKRKGHLRER